MNFLALEKIDYSANWTKFHHLFFHFDVSYKKENQNTPKNENEVMKMLQ